MLGTLCPNICSLKILCRGHVMKKCDGSSIEALYLQAGSSDFRLVSYQRNYNINSPLNILSSFMKFTMFTYRYILTFVFLGPHSETGSACFYTMPGLHNKDPVEYFRILRLAYVKPTGETLTELPIIYPFTFETFTPEVMVPKNGKKKERMERMKECFDRVKSFLKTSGVLLFSCNSNVPKINC